MSYLTAEQVVAAQKAQIETLFGLTHKAFEGMEKLVELNMQVAKSAMVEAADQASAAKNAPAGTENAVTIVKSAVAAANNAFETVQKAAKQAADVAQANMQAMTSTAVKATQTQTPRAKRAA
jgi:hypothetical protein